MQDIFPLLLHAMTILKEMEELTNKKHHDTREYREKQTELNNIIVETLRLMVFKKETY